MIEIKCDFVEVDSNGDQFSMEALVDMKTGEVGTFIEPAGYDTHFIIYRGVKFETNKSEIGYFLNKSELALLGDIRRRN